MGDARRRKTAADAPELAPSPIAAEPKASAPADSCADAVDVVFFDLDDTLIDVNSGWLWAKHEWFLGRIGVRMLVLAIYYLIRYALGYVENLDKALEVAVSNYTGCSAELLREQTAVWFDDEVLPRTRPLARSALDRHRAAGARCVLASSTTQFAAEAARRAYGLHDAVCSRLEVDAATGCLTGRVAALAFGAAKAQRVREWAAVHNVPLQRCTFYTDSYADATLLAEVGVPVCVNPDRRLRALAARRGWRVEDWGRSPAPVRLLKRK